MQGVRARWVYLVSLGVSLCVAVIFILLRCVGEVDYGFRIMGVSITSSNCSRLSELGFFPHLQNGIISYDALTGRLHFDSVLLVGGMGDTVPLLDVGVAAHLFLDVQKECLLRSYGGPAVRVSGRLEIEGSGVLLVESHGGAAFDLVDGTLQVSDLTYVEAKGVGCAITGGGTSESRLVVDDATVLAYVSQGESVNAIGVVDQGAICDLGHLECQMSGILDREMYFDQGSVRVRSSGLPSASVTITSYLGFFIGRVPITYRNYQHLSDPYVLESLRTGKIRYDIADRILLMEDVELGTEKGFAGLYVSGADGLRLELVGSSSILSTGAPALLVEDSMSVVGVGGRLACHSDSASGVSALEGGRLLVSDCTLWAAGKRGLEGMGGSVIYFRDATVTAHSVLPSERGSVSVCADSLHLLSGGTRLVAPASAEFRRGYGVVDGSGESLCGHVEFAVMDSLGAGKLRPVPAAQ